MNEPDRKTKTNEITSDMLVFREDANFHPPKSGSKNEALAPSKPQREGTLTPPGFSLVENGSEPLGPVFSRGLWNRLRCAHPPEKPQPSFYSAEKSRQ